MSAETNQGARRVRVVPRPAGRDGAVAPVDAPTEVLPRVGAAPVPTTRPAAPAVEARPAEAPPVAAPSAEAPPRRARPVEEEAPEGVPERRNGLGVPALVLGLLAAATAWTGWAGVVLGLFGVAAGYLGARRAWKGLATDGGPSLGGLALSAIGLVWGGVVVSQTLFGSGTFGDGLTLDQCLAETTSSFEMHMCKSQHITEFNQRYPNAAE
ncbi:hypothetical protein [Actinomycetospora atypica]|uniref:DUF4190 domain-containing protein n=1 Tax=Actinomycetospora atypica TaxID=1290095 RepID=A0ABV9YTZ3_9PSEU